MKQQLFEKRYQDDWQRFEEVLTVLEGNRRKPLSAQDSAEFAPLYRRMCHLLSLARDRQYSSHLIDRLNGLVLRGHQQLYQRRGHLLSRVLGFIVAGFPAVVRSQWQYVLVAAVLFYAPGALLCALSVLYPELIYSAVSPWTLVDIEAMYDPAAEHVGRPREAETDFAMFGFYIQNNISIAFQTFAGGILFGIGSIFFLVYNSIVFGAVSAHIINVGYQETFFTFVIGHGAFELTAIVLSGAAGLKLGYALWAPGRLSRVEALRSAATVAVKIVYGVILMLLVAAFIEAFWSSSGVIGGGTKYAVGTLLWALVLIYFLVPGRVRGS